MFETQRQQLLQNLDLAHAEYYRSELFGGPSLYFHLQAFQAGQQKNFERFAEMAYAVLTSWGMHRMGSGGAKMCDFDDFQDSLNVVWPEVLSLQSATPESLDEDGWKSLGSIFRHIKCMATDTALVGHSKVMAHALPNLIAPVDRQYTLNFLYGSSHITNNTEREWKKLRMIHEEFFYPLEETGAFRSKADAWLTDDEFPWDTSRLKILDNILIGLVRSSST